MSRQLRIGILVLVFGASGCAWMPFIGSDKEETEAYTTEEFFTSAHARPDAFDALLAAHLLEHMPAGQAHEVISSYLPFVRSGGRVVFITPQERGYRSDASHVRFVGFAEAAEACRELGLPVVRQYSFPFPRAFGRLFTYNEFITVARVP